ncbi:MAG: hypothetical protein EKK40_05920 [Bradyrhizobiaceae bacterium]|nr:MAG: hypothetical protein EKK40_05920 [Bradyrhizobiaceae bacterium]
MKKILGFLAIAGLMSVAMPAQQANALSLANPAGAASAKRVSEGATTQVRWHWRHHHHHHHHHRRHW